MKGSLSNPDSRLWHDLIKSLTPDLPYAHNSGGDPKEIPNLTWEALKEFHATYYHPSRCIFFFYGNLPLKKHLDFIDQAVLSQAEKLPPLPPIQSQKRFKSPKTVQGYYPEKKGQTFISFAWLTCKGADHEELLALSLLDAILMETDASPLKEALIQSGLCKRADGYLDSEMSEIPYAIICRGCDPKNAAPLKELIFKTLREVQIKESQIEAALHQLEFSRLEIGGEGGPFGLTLFMRSVLAMQHGSLPENSLRVHSQFEALRKSLKDPRYLPSLIDKYFLSNPHLVTHIFMPDDTLAEKEEEEEKRHLNRLERNLTQGEKEAIHQKSQELKVYQERAEDLSLDSLPKIGLDEISKTCPEYPLQIETRGQMTLFHHACFTNQIADVRLLFDLPEMPLEELPYLQLFLSMLPELGVGKRGYVENLDFISSYLGDFGTLLNVFPQYEGEHKMKPAFGLRGKALNRHLPKLFQLFEEVCMELRVDEKERIKDLLLQIHTTLESKLNQKAMSYAIKRSIAPLSTYGKTAELLSGVSYFQFIQSLVNKIDQKVPELIQRFSSLKEQLFHLTNPHLILSCDAKQYDALSKNHFYNLCSSPRSPFKAWKNPEDHQGKVSEGWRIAAPVAFTSLAMKVPTHSPALLVSTDLMENKVLHPKIREQGGAYGGGAQYNSLTGIYTLTSYRDPQIAATLSAFKEGVKRIQEGLFTETDLTEAKLGIMQRVDAPISPGSRAYAAYLYHREGQTIERREAFRTAVLEMSQEDVIEWVRSYLDPERGSLATFAGQELLEKEKLPLLPCSI